MESIKVSTLKGFVWKLAQSVGAQVVSFLVQLVLARILTPEDYGVVAIVSIFTNIAMVFINVGFSSAIIQKSNLTDRDISTIFYVNMFLSIIIYAILFFSAPLIAKFYDNLELISMLRISSLIVIIGGSYSIPQALLTRDLEFKKSSIACFLGALIQGLTGIYLALKGLGSWALIYSSLMNYIVCGFVICLMKKWCPKLVFSKKALLENIGFSLKIFLTEFFNSVFNNVRAIIIGKQYTTSDLAYYNKGNQIPTLIMVAVDGSMTSVLFPALSKYQDNWKKGLLVLRRSMKLSLFVCAPIMLGLFAVARPVILFLLTEKWNESVQYVQIGCIICLFWPLSAQRHALNARGYSGVTLFLNVTGKIITLIFLLLTCKHSAQIMVLSTVFSSFVTMIIEAIIFQKYLDYNIKQQIKDILPIIVIAVVMAIVVYPIQFLGMNNFVTIVIQVSVGIIVYLLLSKICRIDSLDYIIGLIKGFLSKSKK